jgi:hypothetical protein
VIVNGNPGDLARGLVNGTFTGLLARGLAVPFKRSARKFWQGLTSAVTNINH